MIWKVILLVCIAAVAQHLYRLAMIMGYHKMVYIHWPGSCRNVNPVRTGSEDLTVTDDGVVFITSGVRPRVCESDPIDPRIYHFQGRIYLFDFNHPEEDAQELKLPEEISKSNFNPHGVDSWFDKESRITYLFVVNHRPDGDAVEIFRFEKASTSLKHIRTVQAPEFRSLNDVVAVGMKEFYVSNDGYYQNCWRAIESLLLLKWASLVHFDGVKAKLVARGLGLNGLSQSLDGKLIYATSPLERTVYTYRRAEDGMLEMLHQLYVGTGVDNIFVHPKSGELWLGAHLQGHSFLKHCQNIDLLSPSQIIRIQPLGPLENPLEAFKLFDPFCDTGELISGSSAAVVYGNKLLIGSVFHKLAFCEMRVPTY
ncbi:Serum paraoxonase/arylesterase 1 [Holothuria leucospilota]|uniref:Paraoxonase n=1 Tax=Holothuria leucospilota TaxID=206669 RepID=A0A9Q1BQY2_HOLLE|nr:Serum paraoxonase/arylesterase 1 [Holothuria leucospilota]